MRFAFILDDKVEMIREFPSEHEAAEIARPYQAVIDITDENPQPQFGWVLSATGLVDPSNQAKGTRHISKEKFLARFTDAELASIEAFAAGTSPYAYALRVAMRKQSVAEYIDLDYEKTISGIHSLVALGLITQDRSDTILTSPVTESERYRG